jgi:hypothetical protein
VACVVHRDLERESIVFATELLRRTCQILPYPGPIVTSRPQASSPSEASGGSLPWRTCGQATVEGIIQRFLFLDRRQFVQALLGSAALAASANQRAVAKWEKPDRRVALVVGIDQYEYGALRFANPTCVSDAEAIAAKLRALGFVDVVLKPNLSQAQLSEAVERFVDDHKSAADLALIFFAGHGVHDGRQSFLLPIDVRTQTNDEVAASSVPLDYIVDRMAEINRRRIVLLNACRDYPFDEIIKGGVQRIWPGQAPTPPGGVAYLFATSPGRKALNAAEASQRNSPFVEALIRNLGKGLPHDRLLKLVQMDVFERTYQSQTPDIHDLLPDQQLLGDEPLEERDGVLLAFLEEVSPEAREQVERIARRFDPDGVPLIRFVVALLSAQQKDWYGFEKREELLRPQRISSKIESSAPFSPPLIRKRCACAT